MQKHIQKSSPPDCSLPCSRSRDLPAEVKHDAREGGGEVFCGAEGACVYLKIISTQNKDNSSGGWVLPAQRQADNTYSANI